MDPTKQISRDDVAKVCESLCSPDVCCPCRDFRHDTAAMLRSLWDELAAANERAEALPELVDAVERAAKCIEDNVWGQREKAADAAPLLREALRKLKARP